MARFRNLTAAALSVAFLSSASSAIPQLRGWVKDDHAGAPVVGAVVRLSLSAMGVVQETETDRSGHFALAEVPSGRYLLEVEKPNFVPTIIQVEAVEGSVRWTASTVRLVRHGVIEGRVDGAVYGEVVAIERVPDGVASRVFRSSLSQDGDFRIFGLPLGRYSVGLLNVRTADRYMRGLVPVSQELVITGGEQHRQDLAVPVEETVVIKGRLEPAARSDGAAVGLVMVSAEQPSLQVWSQLVSAGGTFTVDNLLPGRYSVVATERSKGSGPSKFGRTTVTADRGSADQADQVVLEFGRGASLSLDVKRVDGALRPCPATAVTLVPLEAWLPSAARTAMIAPETVETLTDLAPTQYQVLVQSKPRDCTSVGSSVDLTTKNATATIVVGPPASLRVKLAADADQATGHSIVVADITPGREGYLRVAPARAGEEILFDAIEPGSYRLSVADDRNDRPVGPSILGGRPVMLSPGDAKSIELRVSR